MVVLVLLLVIVLVLALLEQQSPRSGILLHHGPSSMVFGGSQPAQPDDNVRGNRAIPHKRAVSVA
jgi:hypothetical protein